MKIAETVTFGGSGLNRAAELRSQAQTLSKSPDARTMVLWQGKPLVTDDALVWLAVDHAVLSRDMPRVFLGVSDTGDPIFATDMSAWVPQEDHSAELNTFLDPSLQQHPDLPDGQVFAELRSIMTNLTPRDAELAATARGILIWHVSHRHCPACGTESQMGQGGWQRDCGACGKYNFPRTDPVVIMLITHGNSVLLGRSPPWPEGMYSLLAGFVEPGETIEAAVRREVFEEAGIRVGQVDYLASQPWPFPASLMFGCAGVALDTKITLDPNELDDALWLTREELAHVFTGQHPTILPARKGAIAHFLLENWLADRLD